MYRKYYNFTPPAAAAQIRRDFGAFQPDEINRLLNWLNIRAFNYSAVERFLKENNLTEFAEKTLGFSCFVGEIPVIFFDPALETHQRRFVVCHEIGHIVLGHIQPVYQPFNQVVQPVVFPKRLPPEAAANWFAAALLFD